MASLGSRIRDRIGEWIPRDGFFFDRPIVVLQSDDWGRAGLRDEEGLEKLRSAGLKLAERPYDLYTLETAEDVRALADVLGRFRDSVGKKACIGMNFVSANLDLGRMREEDYRHLHLLPLHDGLPEGWSRPDLLISYDEGIKAGVFSPALHGTTHFCRPAVERHMTDSGERGSLLRTLWSAGTPYIHWRMPWIGYEHWDPEGAGDSFLPAAVQRESTGRAVGYFAKLFSCLPRSACAPGYRANADTHRIWSEIGIRVAQNGPGTMTPPHFDRAGLLNLYRTVDFEPAVDSYFSVATCLQNARECFRRGIPAIVSLHSLNFHSSVEDFCSRTLTLLGDFLAGLLAAHEDLIFVDDADLHALVHQGFYDTRDGVVRVKVTKRKFRRAQMVLSGETSS